MWRKDAKVTEDLSCMWRKPIINAFFISPFFVIKSQNLGLDYFNEASSAAEMF
jgi:hypothetical protein